MTDLIKRLEEAEAGSRKLDALIAKEMGWSVHNARRNGLWVIPFGEYETCDPDAMFRLGDYTTSLDAALALAERVLPGWGWEISHDDCIGNYYAWVVKDFYLRGPQEHLRGIQETPALALCIAILKATDTGREG